MTIKQMIEKISLQILILQLQLRIKLLKQKLTVPNLPRPRYVILHHEGGNSGFWGVNAWHKQRWGFKSSLGYYAGYQLYLDKQKRWWRARSDIEEGAHCPGHNKDSIGICVQGDYSREIPDLELKKMVFGKFDSLRAKYNIPRANVLGDKEGRIPTRPTLCPTRLDDWVREYRSL